MHNPGRTLFIFEILLLRNDRHCKRDIDLILFNLTSTNEQGAAFGNNIYVYDDIFLHILVDMLS